MAKLGLDGEQVGLTLLLGGILELHYASYYSILLFGGQFS